MLAFFRGRGWCLYGYFFPRFFLLIRKLGDGVGGWGGWFKKGKKKKGKERRRSGRKYALCKSACAHCFSAPARAASMKVLSLQRHLKSLAWQPVEPMAERAGVSYRGEIVLALVFSWWGRIA